MNSITVILDQIVGLESKSMELHRGYGRLFIQANRADPTEKWKSDLKKRRPDITARYINQCIMLEQGLLIASMLKSGPGLDIVRELSIDDQKYFHANEVEYIDRAGETKSKSIFCFEYDNEDDKWALDVAFYVSGYRKISAQKTYITSLQNNGPVSISCRRRITSFTMASFFCQKCNTLNFLSYTRMEEILAEAKLARELK